MESRRVNVAIDDDQLSFEIVGTTCFGRDEVLLTAEDNLVAGTPFEDQGYTVCRFLSADDNLLLRDGLDKRLHRLIAERVGGAAERPLTEYHLWVPESDHKQIVATTQNGLPTEELPVDVAGIESRISEICGCRVSTRRPDTQTSKFNIRLVRPGCRDNNPPHRDVWLEHLKNAVNIYFPIVGSGSRSSLPLLAGSHYWNEAEIERTTTGASIDGVSYRVPAVVGCKKAFRMTRPPVGPQDVLLFSPYLIHGGGANFSNEATRISLEMRFWRAV